MNLSWISVFSLFVISHLASAKILLIGKNTFLSFDDVEANFTPMVTSSGECGVLYAANPLDACSDLTNEVQKISKFKSSYVLIIRGGCSFEDKVRRAQKAGFEAAIVYNDDSHEFLVPMAGNSSGVHIHGVLVTKATGEVLKEYVGRTDMDLWLIPSLVTSALSIMAISCISLLAMSAVLATCFFLRRRQVRRLRVRPSRPQLFSRMSRNLLQNMPTLIFRGVLEEGSTSTTCAICIDDYHNGDKLRILPCQHKFHAMCIDSWLGHWRSFCPVCKRDARTSKSELPASEHTPLLLHTLTSTSSILLSPSRTQLQSSYDPNSSSTALNPHTIPMYLSRSRSHTSFQDLDQSRGSSHCHSSPILISRSSLDIKNAYSQRSYKSPYLGSLSRSLGQPTTSTLHARYIYRPTSPDSSSPSWVGSSSLCTGDSVRLSPPSSRLLNHRS